MTAKGSGVSKSKKAKTKKPSARKAPTPASLAPKLLTAARTGKIDEIHKLLAKGAEPDRRATGKPTALIAAVTAGQLEAVRGLLQAGADPSFKHGGQRGTTALLEAIRNRQFPIALELLTAGADIHFDPTGKGLGITREAVATCNELHERQKHGSVTPELKSQCLEVLKRLVELGGQTNYESLAVAAHWGNTEVIQLFLEIGVDLNDFGDDPSILSRAVERYREELAIELLQHGADPRLHCKGTYPPILEAAARGLAAFIEAAAESEDYLNFQGRQKLEERRGEGPKLLGRNLDLVIEAREATPLLIAVHKGQTEVVRVLLQAGADLELPDANGFSPLAWAIKLESPTISDLLRKAGAKEPEHLHGSSDFTLITGAQTGDVSLVDHALQRGANVNHLHQDHRVAATALQRAVEIGHLEIATKLLAAGADPDIGGLDEDLNANSTPLIQAARRGYLEIVKLLLEHGADPNIEQKTALQWGFGEKEDCAPNTAVRHAAAAGHTEIVQLLLEAGATSADRDFARGALIGNAFGSGNKSTMKTIAAKQAIVSNPQEDADALIGAVNTGEPEAVQILLDRGVDPSLPGWGGRTALGAAVGNEDLDMVKLLLGSGAKPVAGRKNKETELMSAADTGNLDIIKLLIDAGAQVNDKGVDERTAIFDAITRGHPEVVELLLKNGASVTIENDEEQTPLGYLQDVLLTNWVERPEDEDLPEVQAFRRCEELLIEAEA